MQLTLCAVRLGLLLTLLLLEPHHTVVHDCAGELVDQLLLLAVEAQDVDGFLLSMSREDVYRILRFRH